MTHAEWRRQYKCCPSKFWDAQRDVLRELRGGGVEWSHTGHPFCGLRHITGRRCMYRTCPKLGKG